MMVEEIFIWIIFGFALIRLIISVVNAFSMLYLPVEEPLNSPLVSVLIPARNEATNLPVLLEQLVNQGYTDLEILVYDDHSDDNTASIVKLYERRDSRVKLIEPVDLPKGWLGKNFACHNLAEYARGEYYLFLDADVKVSLDFIKNAVAYMEKKKLDLLSIFPGQEMKTHGEWLTVPLMNWILLSLLPLILVRKSPKPSLAAANGQFMLFNAGVYMKHKWHEQVRDNLVEDIVIIRKMKVLGYKTATLLGNNDIVCRMYTSYQEGVNGFAKNVLEFFGGNSFSAVLFSILIAGGLLIPFFASLEFFITYVLTIVFMRIFISLTSKQAPGKNIIYHIPQMLVFFQIVYKGLKVKWSGKYNWKGRETG